MPNCASRLCAGLLLAAVMAGCGPGFDPPSRSVGVDSPRSGGSLIAGGMQAAGGAVIPGGNLGSGGASAGGAPASGGSIGPSTGGADAGEPGTGATEGSDLDGCRTHGDCPGVAPRCLKPGESYSPPATCGSMTWCGVLIPITGEGMPCTTDTECGLLGTCGSHGCTRLTCSADADCGQDSACVEGQCFTGGGSCIDTYLPPDP